MASDDKAAKEQLCGDLKILSAFEQKLVEATRSLLPPEQVADPS